MNFQSGHLWVLLVFVAISFLQWLVRRLQEQSTITKQKQALERRRTETLRTGRDPEEDAAAQRRAAQTQTQPQAAPGNDAAARQARLRELRQKQLEEMRRRNQGRPASNQQTVEVRVPQRTAGAGPARRTPTVGAPQPAGQRPPSRPAPPRQAPARSPQPPTRQPPTRQAPARPAGTAAPPPPRRDRPQPPRSAPQKPAAPMGLRDTTTPRSLAHTPDPSEVAPPPTQTRPVMSVDGAMTPADWRRAIILSEVLAPPIALRDEP